MKLSIKDYRTLVGLGVIQDKEVEVTMVGREVVIREARSDLQGRIHATLDAMDRMVFPLIRN
jgi:Holliday junction resolvasome RuvABC endonuclease subunit